MKTIIEKTIISAAIFLFFTFLFSFLYNGDTAIAMITAVKMAKMKGEIILYPVKIKAIRMTTVNIMPKFSLVPIAMD